uniref:Kazal-like domain-containing protein n=1 Tax=Macrostomum lignano TaxID=282301 RepID=A0A1I8FAM8_9PLAT
LLRFIKESVQQHVLFLTLYLRHNIRVRRLHHSDRLFPKFIRIAFLRRQCEHCKYDVQRESGRSLALAIMISSLVSKVFPMSVDAHEPVPRRLSTTISALAFPVAVSLFRCDKGRGHGPATTRASCPKYAYKPVCVGGRRAFMTPCLAGCHQTARPERYDSGLRELPLLEPDRVAGHLPHPSAATCTPNLVLFFCIRVVGTIAAVQFTLIMMNSREMKPLAMGSISFLFGLLGVITPPVAGKLIDTVCIVENPSSSGAQLLSVLRHGPRFGSWCTASAAASRCRPACCSSSPTGSAAAATPVEKDEVTRQKLRRGSEGGGGWRRHGRGAAAAAHI